MTDEEKIEIKREQYKERNRKRDEEHKRLREENEAKGKFRRCRARKKVDDENFSGNG